MTKPFCENLKERPSNFGSIASEKALREKATKWTKTYLGKRYEPDEWLTENYKFAYTEGEKETLSSLRELLEKEHRKIYERYIYTKKKSNEQMYNGQMALITKLLAELGPLSANSVKRAPAEKPEEKG